MFKYYLLKVLRNKIYLFWCLVFPLGIMACMNAAFGNIYNIENSIDPVKTIVVAESDSAYAEGFCDLVDEFADESAETKYFDMVEADGREDAMEILKDGWTVVSADHSLTAHYENTILITEDGPYMTTYDYEEGF